LTDEPDIEIETHDLEVPEEQVFVLESEAKREADRCAADARRAAQSRAAKQIDELRAEIETLKAELAKATAGAPAPELPSSAMTPDEWATWMDREFTLGEYEALTRRELRRRLRDWIGDDARWRGRWK